MDWRCVGSMTKLKIGTLVRVLIGVELVDGTFVTRGDIGIIINNKIEEEEHFFTNFDYKILINSGELCVFEDEIEPY